MCLQRERSLTSMKMKPSWKHNMKNDKRNLFLEYLSNSIYQLDIYLYRLRLKPPKFPPILDVCSWCKLNNLIPDLLETWNVNLSPSERLTNSRESTTWKKGDCFKSALESRLIKSQFAIKHPTLFFQFETSN